MKLAIVFDTDPELGSDPLDVHEQPRRLGEFYDTAEGIDTLVVVREYGDEFDGGARTVVFSSGAWENVGPKSIRKILKRLGEL